MLDGAHHFQTELAFFLRDPRQMIFAHAVMMADGAALATIASDAARFDRLPLPISSPSARGKI